MTMKKEMQDSIDAAANAEIEAAADRMFITMEKWNHAYTYGPGKEFFSLTLQLKRHYQEWVDLSAFAP